jgi:hypothetical protein
MLTRNAPTRLLEVPSGWFTLDRVRQRVQPALWQMVALVSFVAGVGSGWQVLVFRAELLSPLVAAATMMLAMFAGWYVWSFFIYLADNALFGGHSDYQGTLNAFGIAYLHQVLFFFAFTRPLGGLWGWIALYLTVAAWGVIGPRRLGMRTWQAILAATLGMLLWLACLLVATLALVFDGTYIGIGAFLA